jgi:hypothetical protein
MKKKKYTPYKGVKARIGKKKWENKKVEVTVDKPTKGQKEIKIEVTDKPKYIYDNVPDFKDFVTLDGTKLKNISDLAEKLEYMDDHVYKHHANEKKNDFSQWIGDVMDDEELAEALVNKDQQEAHVAVLKHMIKKLRG